MSFSFLFFSDRGCHCYWEDGFIRKNLVCKISFKIQSWDFKTEKKIISTRSCACNATSGENPRMQARSHNNKSFKIASSRNERTQSNFASLAREIETFCEDYTIGRPFSFFSRGFGPCFRVLRFKSPRPATFSMNTPHILWNALPNL